MIGEEREGSTKSAHIMMPINKHFTPNRLDLFNFTLLYFAHHIIPAHNTQSITSFHFTIDFIDLGCICLFFLTKNYFLLKRLVFIYLDNFLKLIIISNKSVFIFFVEDEKSNFRKNKFSAFSATYKI